MKKAIFIDRDGTIIAEPADEQIDSLEKLKFVPGAISGLKALAALDYELVMVSNQDGLGTDSFPEDTFWPAHNFMLDTLEGEGVEFDAEYIDRSFPEDNLPTRKPGTAMLTHYLEGAYDLAHSYVIGDRETDMTLAKNLGAVGLQVGPLSWDEIVETIRRAERRCEIVRQTKETDIRIVLDLDSLGENIVDTGLKFFDHMLSQLPHHGGFSMTCVVKGDLEVDEHHTMEDTAIALGEAFRQALGTKVGIQRYGFVLPMDDCRAMCLLDFGGRSELVWDVTFEREYVGDTPTEMYRHFFHSFASAAQCNLQLVAKGDNTHHKVEALFKALARAIRMAISHTAFPYELPSSKGVI